MRAEETQIILENFIQLYELLELIIISFDNWLMHTVYFKIFIISSYKEFKNKCFHQFLFFLFSPSYVHAGLTRGQTWRTVIQK